MEIVQKPSPNFGQRDPSVPLGYVVLHYTDMISAAAALAHLCDPKTEVSAHYLIDEQGAVTQLVDEGNRAWHAGQSFWQGVTDLNSASIGIELANPGHLNGYRAFPKPQIDALTALARDIMQRHQLSVDCVLGHADIAPKRKADPGELFPWGELAAHGIGLWPQPERPRHYAPADDLEVQQLLRAIGYDCPDHGDYDRAMRACLLAFQRHYHQDNLTGTPEIETVARLRALRDRQLEIAAPVPLAPAPPRAG